MALENLDKSLASLVDQLNAAVTSQSAEAVTLAGQLLQMSAQGKLAFVTAAWWIVAAIFAMAAFLGCVSMVRSHEFRNDDAGGGAAAAAALFCIVGAGVFVIVLFMNVSVKFDYTLQAAAKDPKIALARSILLKVDAR